MGVSLVSSASALMDINEIDQPENDVEETSTEHSAGPDSPDSSDIFGESELLPRVGDEYQAAIPDMLSPSELLKYLSCHHNSQSMIDVSLKVHDDVDSSRTGPKQHVTHCSSASDKEESNVKGECLDQRDVTNGYSAVPRLPTNSWSDFEIDSFLLGLYIFGKNLLQVKRFMESKEMGQILSFYYGKFFRTDKYRRWADCRKTKGRKCIIGQRLLIGSRQQELFSRLLPRLSEESRNTSLEAYKAFADGRTSVEEYISTLKNTVGIRALVEAVAIGKVNKDLTIMAMEPSRTSHVHSLGKDYSSLTYEEIIKYLTGDLRLSKARSIDLFWDAVWPRLLAKGWHSEKPKDESFRGSRNCLVFLFPGIKKYGRKLLKGNHYFDSVSDVLKKVASDPEILVLENEEIGDRNSGKEYGYDHDQNRYLKPRTSSQEANDMKFTIVDTGLFIEDEPSKVRELRSLPAHENAIDLSEKLRDLIGGGKKRMANNSSDPPHKLVKNNSDHLSADKQQECIDPVVKRRKFAASSKEETKPKSLAMKQDNCALSLPAPRKKPVQRSHTCNGVSPTSSLVADNLLEKSHKGNPNPNQGSCSSSVISSESCARSDLLKIDLNIPQPPAEESNDSSQNGSHDSSEAVGGSTTEGICLDEQANGNARRQSTRIRPMSTRALEALESRLSNPKAAKKRSSSESQEEKPRPSRRARLKNSMPGNCTVDAVRDSEAMRSNGMHNATSDVLSQALT